ncbi:voltage-gated hydrogen channel 1 [Brachionus plicatilis]|uniref:Voltage-gated hydrogen channel 1 n=1 Tax=Brachionus plicatilis TaxID=10195 RepID=A0A3M7RGX9_BRAPC|nr:voltage-gated hydrogen channel 1 [Brachionus plicatilis]
MHDQKARENLLSRETAEKAATESLGHLQIPMQRMAARNSTVSRLSIQNFIETFPHDENEFTNKEILSTVHDMMWSSIGINSKMHFLEKARLVIQSSKYHAFMIAFVVMDCICVIMQIVLDILFKEEILIPKLFFKSKLEIFDSIIVLISFGLEVVSVTVRESVKEIEAAVITFRQFIFRFWRIIRIVNAIVITVEKRVFQKLDSLKKDMKCLLDENKQMEEEIEEKKRELGSLRIALEQKNTECDEIKIFGPVFHLDDQNVSIKEKIRKVLLSNYLHVAIVVLVILDSLCVTIELIIEAENKNNSHALHVAEEVFKYLGFGILCIFMVEIALKIIFVFNEFRHSKLEILDAIVVVISFIAEIVVLKHDDAISAIVGLIAILRLWRIIRIVNVKILYPGFVLVVEDQCESKISKLNQNIEILNNRIAVLEEELKNKGKISC